MAVLDPTTRTGLRRFGRRSTTRSRRGASIMIGIGVGLISLVVLAAVFAPLLTPWGPEEIDPLAMRKPPSDTHFLGTDLNGMDVWSRVLHAARLDLTIAVSAVALAVVGGTLLGVITGYVGGWFDSVVMRLLEIVQSFPSFILALTVAAMVGRGGFTLVLVIGAVAIPSYARLVRSEVRAIRDLPFLDAARTSGIGHLRVLVRHVLPNSLTPVRTIAPLNVGWAMLSLAGLSFLGLGVPIPEAEWGAMISQGTSDIVAGRLWTTLPPGIALVICVLGFSLLGEGLQDRETARRTR